MRHFITLFSFLFLITFSYGQTFEGKIIYSVSYSHNKTRKKDTAQLIGLGDKEVFYIKNGDYLITGNGKKKEWVLYKSSTNKIYEKYKDNDTLFVIDAGVNNQVIINKYHYRKSAKITDKNHNTGKTTIIKYDEYVFVLDSAAEYYYYNKKYRMNSKLFANHKAGHLGYFVSLSNCIPLIQNFTFGEYNCDKNAQEFIPEKLDESLFAIPNGLTMKQK